MEITKREIIFSIAIISIMLIIGLRIHQGISDTATEKNKEYEAAIHIDSQDVFEYAMRTNIGNAFVYGEYITIDPVTNPEVEGEWGYLECITKRHTMHTRVITTTDSKGHTHTHIQTYMSWDTIRTENWKSQRCSFLGHEFDTSLITLPPAAHITTNHQGSLKYEWYGNKTKYTGSIYTLLKDNTITKTSLYVDKSVDDLMKSMKSDRTLSLVLFWCLWGILISAIVIAFYYIDNRWLE